MERDIEQYKGKTLSSVPLSYNAFLLADLIKTSKRDILLITSNGQELEETSSVLKFLAPDLEVLTFPAWDTVPYDRVSPNVHITGVRSQTLSKLTLDAEKKNKRIIIASIGAVLQKLPPKRVFLNAKKYIKAGGSFDFNAFLHYAALNGYVKVEQVMEPGEFALRGDIIDIFPSSSDQPLRLDLFDETIEKIRIFDPISQRTVGEIKEYTFGLASEVLLDDRAIKTFREAYREAFGAPGVKDEIYESISNGIKYLGFENWLPFFYDEPLLTLFDYIKDTDVIVGQNVLDAALSKQESVFDYYMARLDALKLKQTGDEAVYRPVMPELMYLTKQKFEEICNKRQAVYLSALSEPDSNDVINLKTTPSRNFAHNKNISLHAVYEDLKDYLTANARLKRFIFCSSFGAREKLISLMDEYGIKNVFCCQTYKEAVDQVNLKRIALCVCDINHGFKTEEMCAISEQDILGVRQNHKARKVKAEDFISDVSSLTVGELVVHIEHGVGRFMGLVNITAGGAPHDCLKILYAHDDKLFVPVENIEVISRYGSDDENMELDTLGGAAWQIKKARAKEKIKDIAAKLIQVAAERELKTADSFMPPQELYDNFCSRFEYHETEDQEKAIIDVLKDLNAGIPMDRLICGDVGFGKTEVALRAAFAVASSGAQVALIVPTTLLARQHYLNFKERMDGFDIKVKMLSRLTSQKEASQTIEGLKNGSVEIVIGTHALLSENVHFCNLGLLIIDEEQHFGVAHKEKLKALKSDVHVLTLSATPIPRTLQLSLTGVKNLSIIATPPVDRLAARSFVMPFDGVMIKEALLREKFRGGQSFVVCPRVSDIDGLEKTLKNLVPNLKIAIAHGQMKTKDLENIITDFSMQKYDVLISTTIIESGIDMPSVNTMIVYRADMFGLAQLYQLKGRIGRSKVRGYCYFTVPESKKLKPIAEKRLNILSALDTLGAGFSLASHDMDIRGSGNVLGTEQSGHIKDVGISLYHHMLEEEIMRQKAMAGGKTANINEDSAFSPQIMTGIPIMIPETYVKDLGVRLGLYKRIGSIKTKDELLDMKAELVDRFGDIPPEVQNLFDTIELKQLCMEANISKLEAGAKGILISFHNNIFHATDKLFELINRSFGVVKIRPDQKLLIEGNLTNYQKRLEIVKKYVILLASFEKDQVNG